MLFNSILFLVFFAVVYLAYWNLRGRLQRFFLIAASLVFYAVWGLEREGLWGLRWTAHFVLMALLNYAVVEAMLRNPARKTLLVRLAVVINLTNLGIFKYFEFLRQVLLDVGMPVPAEAQEWSLFLPLAISFYTFQMMAYVIDVHRDVITGREGFSRFLLFIVFFPQLIAGPIMRSSDFMDQIDKPQISKRTMYDGCWLIMAGLTKKVLLADPMGRIVAPVYREPQIYTGHSIMIAGMCFSLQVYCDFSGYTDIARGCARLLGYDIPENFRAPFFSRSARELWQRWHITLATWLRDYIYFPLGGNRVGPVRTYANLAVTFTLGGLWHGADYTYLCWGGMWGVLLAVERFLENGLGWVTVPSRSRILIGAKIFLMFVLFSFGALMFRAQKVVYPDREYSSGRIMVEMFAGLAANTPGAARADFVAASTPQERAQTDAVFGEDIWELSEIGPAEAIIFMFIGLFIFHWAQYSESFGERWRKYDFWLILILGAVLGGLLMPAIATGAHQFIYFVF